MENESLPENLRNVMVTYKKTIYSGPYGLKKETVRVTKRGFWFEYAKQFAVPPGWAHFKGVLLPSGWGGDHLSKENIIRWDPIKEEDDGNST
jgi:hypothetical protein